MKACITFIILGIDFSSQFDQSLEILNVHRDSCEVQSRRAFSIHVMDSNVVTTIEKEDRKDALVPLCSTVHDCLITKRLLIAVTLKVEHQDFDYVSIARGS